MSSCGLTECAGKPECARCEAQRLDGAPSEADAQRMGEVGGPVHEGERLAFEAWMRGHHWALMAAWDGKQYVSHAEQGGNLCVHAMGTRRMWAAWRDRAALACLKTPNVELSGAARYSVTTPLERPVMQHPNDRRRNMTDDELLALAAKAVNGGAWHPLTHDTPTGKWNPLEDDGDALRLALVLGLSFEPYPLYNTEKHSVIVKQRRRSDQLRESNPTECIERYQGDPMGATRRAIVRAAAAVAEQGVLGAA